MRNTIYARRNTVFRVRNTHHSILNTQYGIFHSQYDIRNTQYEKMQNEPKLQNVEMNASAYNTKGYENLRTFCRPKNEPKRTQNEPKLKNAIMNVTPLLTDYYENIRLCSRPKNEPKRTQNEPNFRPKLASFPPNLASFDMEIFAFANKFNFYADLKSKDAEHSRGRKRFYGKSSLFEEKSFENTKVSEINPSQSVKSVVTLSSCLGVFVARTDVSSACFVEKDSVGLEFFEVFCVSFTAEILVLNLIDFPFVFPLYKFTNQGMPVFKKLLQQNRYRPKDVFEYLVFDIYTRCRLFGNVQIFKLFQRISRYDFIECIKPVPARLQAFTFAVRYGPKDITYQDIPAGIQKIQCFFNSIFGLDILKAFTEQNKVVPPVSFELLVCALEYRALVTEQAAALFSEKRAWRNTVNYVAGIDKLLDRIALPATDVEDCSYALRDLRDKKIRIIFLCRPQVGDFYLEPVRPVAVMQMFKVQKVLSANRTDFDTNLTRDFFFILHCMCLVFNKDFFIISDRRLDDLVQQFTVAMPLPRCRLITLVRFYTYHNISFSILVSAKTQQ